MSYWGGWRPYVSQAERRHRAALEMAKLKKKGHPVAPVVLQGKTIASTFWGKAWCDNLEGYGDYANRLPRGRTYVRNGSVVDLQIAEGEVSARVSGSDLYKVKVDIVPAPKARWKSICKDCAGGIDSLVELLQGRFSKAVMERICRQRSGLFPAPEEIHFSCSCPDWASMCKHVAAVLYGVGSRLDEKPELLFRLRKVDEKDLLTGAAAGLPISRKKPAAGKVLDTADLSTIFGLDLASETEPESTKPARAASRKTASKPRAKKAKGKRTRGVSCVGKTSIGAILASRLGCQFYDLDVEIERFFKTSIEQLRNKLLTGESFRSEASRVLMHILENPESRNCVIALPPSGLMGRYLRVLKRAGGTIAVLTDKPENILNRITFYDVESHPIEKQLTEGEKLIYLREIKKDITYYRKSYDRVDFRVDISGMSAEEAAEKVQQSLKSFLSNETKNNLGPGGTRDFNRQVPGAAAASWKGQRMCRIEPY